MKLKHISVLLFVVVTILAGIGVYNRMSYKDFNESENALESFAVALIDEDFLDAQVQIMDEKVRESNIVIAVKCEDTFTYRYSCVTQKVTVENVFKGDGIKKGDEIEIARASSLISTDEDALYNDKYLLNMGFVNQMIPGKNYLIFLDRKLNTYDEEVNIYIQSDEHILAPIFCYEEITNIPKQSDDEASTYIEYEEVQQNEFFVMSEKSNEKILKFKEELLKEYNYN